MSKPAKPKDDAAPRKTGRPSKYTPELAAEIARRLSDGEPLRQICRDEHMPHWTNIYEWMARDQEQIRELHQAIGEYIKETSDEL